MFVHINKKRIFHLWYGCISIYYFVSFLFFCILFSDFLLGAKLSENIIYIR